MRGLRRSGSIFQTRQRRVLILDRQLPDLNADELVELTNRRYPRILVLVVDPTADEVGEERGETRPRGGFTTHNKVEETSTIAPGAGRRTAAGVSASGSTN